MFYSYNYWSLGRIRKNIREDSFTIEYRLSFVFIFDLDFRFNEKLSWFQVFCDAIKTAL